MPASSAFFFFSAHLHPQQPRLPTTTSISVRCITPNTERDPEGGRRNLPAPSSEKPWLQTHNVKMPTAPWMQGPLLLPAEEVLNFSKDRKRKTKREESSVDRSLTDKVRGGRSKGAMRNIVRSITKLQRLTPVDVDGDDGKEAQGIDFSIPLEQQVAGSNGAERKRMVPWGNVVEKVVFPREKKEGVVTTAKRVLPKVVLQRLQEEARNMDKWVKAKKAGVTEIVVDEIKRAWRRRELVMVKFHLPLSSNMVRAREIIEIKTGGLVVWSKRDTLVVYRGSNYQLSPKAFLNSDLTYGCRLSVLSSGISVDKEACPPSNSDEIPNAIFAKSCTEATQALFSNMGWEATSSIESVGETFYEKETNRLLDGLGPRFIDWWWRKPLPVDADLLPEVVPNFKTPLRRCPPRVRPTLSNDELTYLRKLARSLPTHFALGKNRKLHGLSAAIIKLWEKCPIAKIAVKLGCPNTDNERMSYQLKKKLMNAAPNRRSADTEEQVLYYIV
ncbi:hypothetical protein J5N97_004113 [Dioscorea zingiberensis]|uniref:CRM domain-containing protein n=1 Tax=Dioscorea zingiberensis TaxID=325984 RepID=A0A9D5HRU1_9LILI|nr:hypothetical protein J5N97_004113 [Dioscorea zingiberensis]